MVRSHNRVLRLKIFGYGFFLFSFFCSLVLGKVLTERCERSGGWFGRCGNGPLFIFKNKG
jgi:hypothetical protein